VERIRDLLESVFRAAVAAVDPAPLVAGALARELSAGSLRGHGAGRRGAVYVVGAGKAARGMVEGALAVLGERVGAGIAAVPHGAEGNLGPVRLVGAGHPLADRGSRAAARAAIGLLLRAKADDLVVALLSGGGSAMLSLPAVGVGAADKNRACALLLGAGAPIGALNAVRKHLSRVKGGWLARAAVPARVIALLLSDVPGDDPSVIASGPLSPDPTTYAEALGILAGLGLRNRMPASVRRHLEMGAAGRRPETPKPGDPAFARVACAVVGSNGGALEAAAAAARAKAARVVVLPGFLRGEARDCGRAFAARLREAAREAPEGGAVLVAGGETTVRVRGRGRGGRCQEFALAAALELAGTREAALLCAGTDGRDGPTEAAGAFADGTTCARALERGFDPRRHLEENDALPLFHALGDLVVTGPTGTNAADVALGFVVPAGSCCETCVRARAS